VKRIVLFIAFFFGMIYHPMDMEAAVIKDLLEQASENINNRKEALKTVGKALDEAKKSGNALDLAKAHFTYGEIYKKHSNPIKANRSYNEALKWAKAAGDVKLQMNCHLRLAQLNDNVVKYAKAIEHYKAFSVLYQKELLNKNKSLKKSLGQASEQVETQEGMIQDLKEDSLVKEKEIDSLSTQFLMEQLKTKDLEIENEQKNVQISREKNKQNKIIGIAIILGLAVFFVLFAFIQKQRSSKILSVEKAKSDSLLLNILPSKIAEELKDSGTTTPQHYKLATVLFTDFKGFTSIAERMPPKELVQEIDYCFKAFDEIVGRYEIEKIKTIGDAYLCVSGLPNQNPNHVNNILRAAIELQEFMKSLAVKRKEQGREYFEMRVGVHCGPLVAGVVGSTKFAYDIWGDTVNTAARMEQSCEPGKINVSQSVVDLAHEFFSFTYRGDLEAKNKGQLAMYFLEKQKVLTA
jgi:adenylate cyclase